MLPQENDVQRYIEAHHALWLELLRDAINTGLDLLGAGPEEKRTLHGQDGRGVTEMTLHLVLGLWVKATKQARSILLLCERGFVEDADTIVRCLFETSLSVEFLIRRKVALKNGKRKIATGKGAQCKPLTTARRSSMYGSSWLIEQEKLFRQISSTRGMKRHAKRIGDPVELAALMVKAEKDVGAGWMKRLREQGFPGVNGADLAASLGADYERARILYRVWSWRSHARDSLSFAEPSETAGTTLSMSPDPDPSSPLLFSIVFYCAILDAINKRLRVGGDESLKALKRRIRNAQGG